MKHYEFNPDAVQKNVPVEISQDERAVLLAMYHKGRGEWPEWFGSELARKTKLPPYVVTACLSTLSLRGYVQTRPGPKRIGTVAAWHATDAGKLLRPSA